MIFLTILNPPIRPGGLHFIRRGFGINYYDNMIIYKLGDRL
ncbi:hypothetical protein SPLC1_S590330 [Arthrospira platensis C1]|nr:MULTISPECIES: hypothetical protein [unclassified Limnospira]EKD05815.1 hypothetical protein SPLC1_S590330 [Arthrospira platensis C1]